MDVYVSARKLSLPPVCPCCDEYPDGELTVSFTRTSGKRVIRQQTRGWTFPYCRRCLAHVELWNTASGTALGVTFLGLIAAISAGAVTGEVAVGLLILAAALLLSAFLAKRKRDQAAAACAPGCGSARASVAYRGWDGTVHGFHFTSPRYAARFAGANARALVNVDADLRQLLASGAEPGPLSAAVHRPSER